ncbi:uncharacterized protein TrAtP1_011393 [Trichoderma atroviride]|uniref:uncharacterized protein n=1 Tax=Hypocrea atroviridis TaxID=63577 RepID=UPI003334481E|nr:hypothetical protein TrAtP1_011393 [Trichoderma atroviride]
MQHGYLATKVPSLNWKKGQSSVLIKYQLGTYLHGIVCPSLQVGCQNESRSNAADLIGYQGLHICAEENFGDELDALAHHWLHPFHVPLQFSTVRLSQKDPSYSSSKWL